MLHTLHIGINYKGSQYELGGCENDARDWAKALKASAASQIVLTGKRADRDGIERAIAKLKSRLEPGDEWFATNSSHGTREPDAGGDERTGYDQAIVCADFELLFDDQLAGFVAGRPDATPGFLFFDNCFGGTPHRGLARCFLKTTRAIPFAKCKTHTRKYSGHTLRSLVDVLTFSGSGDGPTDYCYDATFRGRGNGAATYLAIEARRELPERVSYRRWFTRLCRYLPSDDFPQVPQIHGSERLRSRSVPYAP